MRCWGYDKLALLFLDNLTDPPEPGSFVTSPTEVPQIHDSAHVDGGDAHSCALTTSHDVKCWGWNGIGQLGTGNFADAPTPIVVPLSAHAQDLTVGVAHTCAALDNGNVACWGLNENGQIGNGETGSGKFVSSPFELWLGFPAQKVSATDTFTCATVTTLEMACWGGGTSGQLGNGTSNNTVPSPVLISGLTNMKQFEGGTSHSCAVGPVGELSCWGDDSLGAVGVSAGGIVNAPAPVSVAAGAPVADIALGENHTCALTNAGAVFCWGLNNRGQLGTGDTTSQLTPTKVVWH